MVIAVTSTVSGEGKTFVAVNLASIISLLGRKTLLVGLDLRKPRIHKILGLDNSEGMSTFLSSNSKYDEIIQKTSIENLWFAAAGPIPPNPAELIERKTMTDFLEKARKQFDLSSSTRRLLPLSPMPCCWHGVSDMTLFVVRQRYTSKNTFSLIDEIYRNGRSRIPGIVVNDISMSGYYGYGLRYGYTMGYAYGYNYGYKYYGHTAYGKGAKDEAGAVLYGGMNLQPFNELFNSSTPALTFHLSPFNFFYIFARHNRHLAEVRKPGEVLT